MSKPIFKYRMIAPRPLPKNFTNGRYVMAAVAFGVLPIDHQQVISMIKTNEANGEYSIHNVSKGLPYSWDHLITLKDNKNGTCTYTDGIDISSGFLSLVYASITRMIFKRRQVNWTAFGKT